jgi:hypothetical protein
MDVISITIAPQSDLPKQERMNRTKDLAKEIERLEGVERAEFHERFHKSAGLHDLITPAVITVAIKATRDVIVAFLAFLQKKREQGDHKTTEYEVTIREIGQLQHRDDEALKNQLEDIKELIEKRNAGDRVTSLYVGIYDRRGRLMAIGLGFQEAFRRGKCLGFDLSAAAEPNKREVSADQYDHWWWKELSSEQRSLLTEIGGSYPP